MAKKTKKNSKSTDDSNIVRIKASAPSAKKVDLDESTDVVITKSTAKSENKGTKPKTEKVKKPRKKRSFWTPFRAAGGYFKGAWVELRQVRWPNRRATWGLTFAVLVYSAFFVALILLLDAGFKYLFELIIGK